MIGLLKKIKLCSLVFSLFFTYVSSASETFEELSEKMVKKFSVASIDAKNLKEKMNSAKVIVLDVREFPEYKISHIPGAKHVGYKKFDIESTLKKVSFVNEIIVYCSVGYRSGKIAERLKKKGLKVYNLKGGIFGWANKAYPLVNERAETTKDIHGYSRSWSKWLKKGRVRY